MEYLVKLPHTNIVEFGCFQNFVYTGEVYDKRGGKMVPDYPILMGVWRLATHLKMASLRVAVLDAMAERRQQTGFIPSTTLLVEAWKQTEEGSGLRKMFIEWAAEHSKFAEFVLSCSLHSQMKLANYKVLCPILPYILLFIRTQLLRSLIPLHTFHNVFLSLPCSLSNCFSSDYSDEGQCAPLRMNVAHLLGLFPKKFSALSLSS